MDGSLAVADEADATLHKGADVEVVGLVVGISFVIRTRGGWESGDIRSRRKHR